MTHYLVLTYDAGNVSEPELIHHFGTDVGILAHTLLESASFGKTMKVFMIDEDGMTEVAH